MTSNAADRERQAGEANALMNNMATLVELARVCEVHVRMQTILPSPAVHFPQEPQLIKGPGAGTSAGSAEPAAMHPPDGWPVMVAMLRNAERPVSRRIRVFPARPL
jgi:hypothetical protein